MSVPPKDLHDPLTCVGFTIPGPDGGEIHFTPIESNAQLRGEIAGLRSENAMLERDNAMLERDVAGLLEDDKALRSLLIEANSTASDLARGQEDMANIISDLREERDHLLAWIESQFDAYPQRVAIGFDGSSDGLMEDPLLGSVDQGNSVHVGWIDPAAWDAVVQWSEPADLSEYTEAINDTIKSWSASFTIPGGTMSRAAMRLIFGIELPYVEPEDHIVLSEN